jgi:pyroglutamyl-peptidase
MKTSTVPPTKPTRHRVMRFRLVAGAAVHADVAALAWVGYHIAFGGAAGEPADPAPEKAVAKTPVILLTGFEPFGKKKPPNPSWEGIKALDGRLWNGHKIVCKQVPVVWGEPLNHLQTYAALYEPVAIFAFGQGGKGAFSLETKASSRRGAHKDNNGDKPWEPVIAEDGPSTYHATIDYAEFIRRLYGKGYEIRISTTAGRYLCEEMLYSLEHLKATRLPEADVMFCHVPPLDSAIGERPVTAEYVQQFVEDVLETWYAVSQAEPAPEHKEIKEFIHKYFRTWSEQDMKGYESCFAPEAVIQHIDGQGRLTTTPRVPFIASQRDYHRTSPFKTTEVPETIDIRIEKKLARVVVFWKLTAGPRVEYGYDHFTLMQAGGGWRIVNLVFYVTPPPGKKAAE